MWTRRDYAVLAAAAGASFGLTLAVLSPRVATAVEQGSPTQVVKMPVLQLDGCDVYAQVARTDEVLQSSNASVTVKPGAVPAIQLVVHNTSPADRTVAFDASMTAMTRQSAFSRRPIIEPPVWSDCYTLELKAGETRTITISTGATLEAGSIGRLMLTPRKAPGTPAFAGVQPPPSVTIVALTLNTQPPLNANGIAQSPLQPNPAPQVVNFNLAQTR